MWLDCKRVTQLKRLRRFWMMMILLWSWFWFGFWLLI